MQILEGSEREGLSEFLHACRKVLTADVLARDRTAALSRDPSQWPRAEGAAPGDGEEGDGLDGRDVAIIDHGQDLQEGLALALERALADGAWPDAVPAMLDLLLDCVRVRFVYEETAMRLRVDPERFEHGRVHGQILDRLVSVKGLLRARRPDAARAVVARFRTDLAAHEASGAGAGRAVEGVTG